MRFTIKAIFSGPLANSAKKAPIIWKKGAPGGCPTCSLAEVAIYSPASQKLAVGSTVNPKVRSATVNTSAATIRFQKRNCFAVILPTKIHIINQYGWAFNTPFISFQKDLLLGFFLPRSTENNARAWRYRHLLSGFARRPVHSPN